MNLIDRILIFLRLKPKPGGWLIPPGMKWDYKERKFVEDPENGLFYTTYITGRDGYPSEKLTKRREKREKRHFDKLRKGK